MAGNEAVSFDKKFKSRHATSKGDIILFRHGAIVRNRDLIDVWIEAPRGNRKQKLICKNFYRKAESILEIINFEERDCRIKVICKWGFDGSSGHSQYKQKFSDLENTDEFLFLVAMTPLRLIDMETNTIETKEGHYYIIEVDMMLTMLDGSVGNVLSETNSTMKCIICGATPKDMNTLAGINRPPNVDNYRFGLSTLHCWIRFFEYLLHIGYRLPIKSWQVRVPENKAIVEANKKRIQAEFRAKLSLIVDKPKPGYGSSNDGNTARIFFHNPQTSSDITGVDRELIEKIAIILGVLASGCAIDMEKFASLLEEARNLYIHLYKWYNMPNTVHNPACSPTPSYYFK
ncbi:unnamed protein product [Acanthoscelides obtectus]|uniref:Uncharacterized protein n=1 Tax=Acanthoscelides obtectus TaxID=200917 RepID=A0A9P0LT84_ACAOB|nr:unnamed protein product [Acanthoscelides obtectus]CAK1643553.1 hypothetical protein AOBTE_LOCUS13576 [Acanthoscelides obtectus]